MKPLKKIEWNIFAPPPKMSLKLWFWTNGLSPNWAHAIYGRPEARWLSSLLALARPFGTLRSTTDATTHLLTQSKYLVPTSTLSKVCLFVKFDFLNHPLQRYKTTLFSQWIQGNICGQIQPKCGPYKDLWFWLMNRQTDHMFVHTHCC